MKTNRLAIIGCALALLVSTNMKLHGQTGDTPYAVVERGANHRVWERTQSEYSVSGDVVPRKHRYTELATGMNYQDAAGQWVESEAIIQPQAAGGAAAVQGQHQAYFPYDIYRGTIQLVTPEGKHLKSRPLGLSYDDGVHTVLIAELKGSVGQLMGSNQVIYPEAFTDLKADVRYTYTKAGFEQDIVLREQPPTPESLGLNPQTARLQVLTEFFDTPEPKAVRHPGHGKDGQGAGQAELTDTTLDFGGMEMGSGQAFSVENSLRVEATAGTHGTAHHGKGHPVYKTWSHLKGRTFLIEELPFNDIQPELQNLSGSGEQSKMKNSSHLKAVVGRILPASRPVLEAGAKSLPLASADLSGQAGVVLDYNLINTSQTGFTFQGDTTYFISGTVIISGTNFIEGGTVIKYDDSGTSELVLITRYPMGGCNSWTFKTGPYRPAIFTSMDDDTVGETISGSSGSPGNTQATYLCFDGDNCLPNPIQYARFSYAGIAIQQEDGTHCAPVLDCQFVNCAVVMLNEVYNCQPDGVLVQKLHNVLMSNCGQGLQNAMSSEIVDGENMTVDQMGTLLGAGFSGNFTNCIFTGIQNGLGSVTLDHCVQPPNGSVVYQTIGAGNYYLANDTYRNFGTTTIDPTLLTDLRQKTTHAPCASPQAFFSDAWIDNNWFAPGTGAYETLNQQVARDTNAGHVDLGYHYDPLDYYFDGYNVLFAGTLTVTNGVQVGFGGPFYIEPSAGLVSQGKADQLNRLVQCRTVQEQAMGWSGDPTISSDAEYCSSTVNCRFTEFSRLAGPGGHVSDDYKGGTWNFRDCQFRGAQVSFMGGGGGCTLNVGLTNCLFERTKLYAGGSYLTLKAYNNLFYNGDVWLSSVNSANAFTFRDNFFYQNNLMNLITSGTLTDDHNGYITNYNRLGTGTGDQVLTSFTFQSSWLGDYYQLANSLLIDAGSTTADKLGLYHYTTQTNQIKEGFTTVDIGYHYVATDAYGKPLDSSCDGIPDYIADKNGNGIVDTGEIPWAYPPTLLCSNMTVACGSPIPTNPPAWSDSCCSNVVVTLISSVTTNNGCIQAVYQTWKAVDQCYGTSNTCVRTITTLPCPPTLWCSNMTISCGSPIPTNPPAWSDPCCSNVVVTLISSVTTNNGCIQAVYQTWKAVDQCYGTSNTCVRTITTLPCPPTLWCSNITVACGSPIPTNPPAWTDPCCSSVVVTLINSVTTNNGCIQMVYQTWKAVDQCYGMSNTCVRTITTLPCPPTLWCSNMTISCGSPIPTNPPAWTDPCCSSVVVTLISSVEDNVAGHQVIYQTWQAVDQCYGTSNTCVRVVTVSCSPTNCVSPSSCLVGWWPGESNANDIVGGNNGTVVSGTVGYAPAEVGLGFDFDGGANMLFVPNAPALNFDTNQDFSIEVWISPSMPSGGMSSEQPIVWKSDYKVISTGWMASPVGYKFAVVGGQLECELFDSSGNYDTWRTAGPDLRDGNLHHVALTVARNSTTGGHMYVDGMMALEFDPTSVPGDLSNTNPMAIGYYIYNNPNDMLVYWTSFCGIIDELSIYNCALSSNEIAAVYNAGSYGKCPPTNPPPTKCVSPSSCLVGWWPGEGNANDIVGNDNGAMVGGTSFAAGKVGQAFSLSGSNYVAVPDAPALNPTNAITVECWLYRQAAMGSYDPVVKKNGTTDGGIGNGYALEFNGNNILFWIYSNNGGWRSSGGAVPIQFGQWYHVAGVYDGAHLLVYTNGQLAVSTSTSGSIVPSFNTLCFGTDPTGLGRRFNGLVDEVSIYNCALSSNEIAAVYYAGSYGKCPPVPPTNCGCCQVMQNGTCVDVTAISINSAATNVCGGGSVVFTATTTPAGGSVNWSVDPSNAGTNFTGCSVSNTFTPASGFSGTATIYATCGTNTASATITVSVPPIITQAPTDISVNAGSSVQFSVTASGGGLTYQWAHDGVPMSGQVNPSLTINNAQPADAGGYSVTVANNAGVANAGAQLLVIQIQYSGGSMGKFTLSGAPINSAYDIYVRPSLSSGVKYRLFYCGSPGQTVFNCPWSSASFSFFQAGAAWDTDGDGLMDGYEALVSYSDRTKQITLSGGLPDGWNVEWGLDPTTTSGGNGPLGDPDNDVCNNSCEYNGGVNSTDPWRINSNPRPVVSIAVVNGAFQITRSGASLSSSLAVNYTVGGPAIYGQDYTLNPAPSSSYYPFSITIPAGSSSVTLNFTPKTSVSNTLMVALVPYALSDSAPANWTYVVDPFHDRASAAFQSYPMPGLVGILINLHTNSQGYLQINDKTNTSPLPFVNVAKTSKGMVARIQISTNISLYSSKIIGQYYTSPNNNGNDSRTVVDRYGNVWVANRNDNSDSSAIPLQPDGSGDHGSITELGVVLGGTRGYKTNDLGGTNYTFVANSSGDYLQPPFIYNTCVDRDGDGLIHTSRGLDSLGVPVLLPWPNSTDVTNAADEVIVRYVKTIANGVRTIAFDATNNIWVGGIGGGGLPNWHELIDTVTGIPVTGQKLNPSGGGYGGLMDPFGIIWTVQNSGAMFCFTPSYSVPPAITAGMIPEPGIGYTAYGSDGNGNYGIGVDPATGNVWGGIYGNDDVYQYSDNGSSSAWNIPDGSAGLKKGIVVDGNSNVWVAGADGGNFVFHLLNTGAYVGAVPLTFTAGTNTAKGSNPYGVSVDSQGMIWATCYYQDPNYKSNNSTLGYYAMRIDPNKGATTTIDGTSYHVGQVVEVVDLGPNGGAYDLADETGFRILNSPEPAGVWDFIQDSGTADQLWTSINENAAIPAGASIITEVRAANRITDLPSWPFRAVSGTTIPGGIKGRYMEVRVNLLRNFSASQGPTLTNLTVVLGTNSTSGLQITNQPQSQMVFPGSNVTFSVKVSTQPGVTISSYQWRTNDVNVYNGGNISGATTATLTVTNVQYTNAARYSVRITDSTGTVLDSVEARLHIMGNPPVVSQQPVMASSPPYPPNTFIASATVLPASGADAGYQPVYYQWLSGLQPIAGASGPCTSAGNNKWNATLTVSNLTCQNIGRYCVFFWNQYGEILSQTVGNNAATNPVVTIASTTFTVHPTVGSGWTYQWYTNNSSGTKVAIVGATMASYTVPTDPTGQGIGQGTYIVLATGSAGATASAQVEVQNSYPEDPSVQPDDAQNATVDVAYTAAATGIGVTYKWYDNNGVLISGATGATYTIPAVGCPLGTTHGSPWGNYRVQVNDACGNQVSTYVYVNFNPIVIIASSTFTLLPTAGGSGWVYQWYTNNSSGTMVAIVGATSASYTVPTDPTGRGIGQGTYTVLATNSAKVTASAKLELTGNWTDGPTVQPDGSQNATVNVTFTAAQTQGVGIGTWAYQWYDNNGDPISAPAGTNYYYTITSVGCNGSGTQSGWYSVYINDGCSDQASSDASLNPIPNPVVTIASTTFTVHPTVGSGWTYQWYTNNSSGTKVAIVGATSASYTVPTDPTGQDIGHGTYIVLATGSAGATASAQLEVQNSNPGGLSVQPDDALNATVDVAYTAAATGIGVTYQWYHNGNLISGATGASYTNLAVGCPLGTTHGKPWGNYQVQVNDACGNSAGTYAYLNFNPIVTIASTTFTVLPTAGGSGWVYQWYTNNASGTMVKIVGATSASYTVPTDPTGWGIGENTYTVLATNSAKVTASAQIELWDNWPSGPELEVDAVQSATVNVTFTAAQTQGVGIGTWAYQWYDNSGNPISAPAGTNYYYTITSASCTMGGYYQVQINDGCSDQASAYPYLDASPSPIVYIASTTFTMHPTVGSGWTYQWYTNNSSGTKVAIVGATSASYTVTMDTNGDGIGQGTYIVLATGSAGATASAQLEVPNSYSGDPSVQPDDAQNATVDVAYTALASGAGVTYQWYDNNGSLISGATGASYTNLAVGCPLGTTHGRPWGGYTLQVNDSCGNSASTYAYLNFNPIVIIASSTFTAIPTAGGSGWVYQWYTNNASGIMVKIVGATSASYTVPTDPTGRGIGQGIYTVLATNSASATASAKMELTDNWPSNPELEVDAVQSATVNVTFTAAQTQGVGIGTWAYQWYDNNGNPISAPAGTNYYYTVSSFSCGKGGWYRVQINDGCSDQTSASGYINDNTSVAVASTTFTVHPTGGSGWTYQWYTNNSSGMGKIVGATTSSYTVPMDPTGQGIGEGTYIVLATGSAGATASAQFEVVNSNAGGPTVQVDSALSDTVDVGFLGQPHGIGTWTYQWYDDRGNNVGSGSQYIIQNVNLADQGSYTLYATPDNCSATQVTMWLDIE